MAAKLMQSKKDAEIDKHKVASELCGPPLCCPASALFCAVLCSYKVAGWFVAAVWLCNNPLYKVWTVSQM